jgi:hypothetical protein
LGVDEPLVVWITELTVVSGNLVLDGLVGLGLVRVEVLVAVYIEPEFVVAKISEIIKLNPLSWLKVVT